MSGFYFDSSINFLSLILALVAILLATITLLTATSIKASEEETKKDLLKSKRNKFEFTFREFYVLAHHFYDIELDEERMSIELMIDNMLVSLLVLLKDLRLALNDYAPHERTTYQNLQTIDSNFQFFKQVKKRKSIIKNELKRTIKTLEKIAKKYDFDPLSV